MTDASLADRIAARLERLAEMDLAAAEHVHAQLMATTEPKAVAELSRAYQRASRTLRQTLMLQMKHAREQDASPADTPSALSADEAREDLLFERIGEVQDAVGRVAAAAHPDSPARQREALDRLDCELDDWAYEDDGFLDTPLDDVVVAVCERLDLPAALAREWKALPRARHAFDPATAPPVPEADTG